MNFEIINSDANVHDVVFAKPQKTGHVKACGLTLTTQKNKQSHRLCITIADEILNEMRLREGDALQIGFKNNTLFLKVVEEDGFKLTRDRRKDEYRVPACRLYSGSILPEWGITDKLRLRMKGFSMPYPNTIVVNF